MKLKITVVMSEYQTRPDYLRTSIESILAQTYDDFEFIIVLDGINLESKSIIESYEDSRIVIMKNSINRGLIYSLNRAIRHAKGTYIVRMDTDDIASEDRIEKLVNFIKSNPEYDVVGSRVIEFSEDGNAGLLGSESEKTKKSIMKGDPLIHPSVIMRREAVLAVGGYPDFKRAEDLGLWCELLISGSRLYVINDVLLRYRVNLQDYSKRKLKYRGGELRARFHYYPKFNASILDYVRITRFIVSGLLPNRLVQLYRSRYKLKHTKANE